MAGSWKKRWQVRSYPEAVQRVLRAMPRVYEDGTRDGVVGWAGRTYSHQRRDLKVKPPKLTSDKPNRLVFQHDLLTPFTYTIDVFEDEDGQTEVQIEVRTSAMVKDTAAADAAVTLCYALTKALEPLAD